MKARDAYKKERRYGVLLEDGGGGFAEGQPESAIIGLDGGRVGQIVQSCHCTFEIHFSAEYQETAQPLLRLVMTAPGTLPRRFANHLRVFCSRRKWKSG